MTEEWREVEAQYDMRKNVIKIDAKRSDFDPKYLEYLLEYYGIPKDVKVVFLKGD